MVLVEEYVTLIGYSKGAETYIRENGFLIKKEDYRGKEYEALSGAAVLLLLDSTLKCNALKHDRITLLS